MSGKGSRRERVLRGIARGGEQFWVRWKPGAGESPRSLWGGLQLRSLVIVGRQSLLAVSCDQIGVWANCQTGIIQQLMEAEAETRRHISGEVQEFCGRGGERMVGGKGEGSRTQREGSQNQLTYVHGGSQRLNRQPGSLHETDLGTVHLYYSCVAWSSYS